MKTFALALGAGGARGLAHVAVIEALDEMGLKPSAIAGSSIGAVIGAGYATGLSGRTMRRSLLAVAHNRGEVMSRLMAVRAVGWLELLGAGFGNPLVVDAMKFYEAFLGDLLPGGFRRTGDSAHRRDDGSVRTRDAGFQRGCARAGGRCLDGGARAGAAAQTGRPRPWSTAP